MKRVVLGMAAIAAAVVAPQAVGAQASADLTLVHGIPGVPVDLVVDGTVVIDSFAPGSLANISSFAGQTLTNVEVLDDATGDVVIGPIAELPVPDSGSHSIVAFLDAAGTPVLNSFENNSAPVGADQARLTVRHTAAAGPVDIVVGDQRPITNLSNGESSELEQAAGTLSGAQLAPTGGDPIADLAPLELAASTNTVVYAVGSVDDDTLDFVVQVVTLVDDTPATTEAGATTTTDPNATTTTTDPNATTTTSTSTTSTSTTTTAAAPTAVNTGSPLDGDSNTLLIVVALGGLALAGTAMVARRRT